MSLREFSRNENYLSLATVSNCEGLEFLCTLLQLKNVTAAHKSNDGNRSGLFAIFVMKTLCNWKSVNTDYISHRTTNFKTRWKKPLSSLICSSTKKCQRSNSCSFEIESLNAEKIAVCFLCVFRMWMDETKQRIFGRSKQPNNNLANDCVNGKWIAFRWIFQTVVCRLVGARRTHCLYAVCCARDTHAHDHISCYAAHAHTHP